LEEIAVLKTAKHRSDIQALRGLAVLAVVFFHAYESYFPQGYLGVDVFFVISGFVITPLILRIFTQLDFGERRLTRLKLFYVSRFYRLAPALAVFLIISTLAIFLVGLPGDHQRFVRQGFATVLLLGNYGAYEHFGDYFNTTPHPLIHTWSLSVEEQIYFLLPVFLILTIRGRDNPKKMIFLIYGFITLLSFISFLFPNILAPIYSNFGITHPSRFSFYSPIDRIWQFTIGGLGYFLLENSQNRIAKFSKGINVLLTFVLMISLFSSFHANPQYSAIFVTLISLLILTNRSLYILPNFSRKYFEWVGNRSYSIYLIHMPLLYLAKHSPVTGIGNNSDRGIQSVLAIFASLILGSLSYSKIEERFRKRTKNFSITKKSISVALTLNIVFPLILLFMMDFGYKHQYWGFDRNVQQPAYAGFLDSKCKRDSEIGPPCTYLDEGAKNVALLIGDSHAAHIAQAVVGAGKSQNWNIVVWTHGGCQIQFQKSDKGDLSDDCIKVNRQMKKWVLENRPNAIIVSQFVQSKSSQIGLMEALTSLRAIVPNILLVENSPVFPDGKDFMFSRPLIMSPYSPPKTFAEDEMELNDKNASDQLAEWARQNRISTLNFWSLFCKNGTCSRYSNGYWLYRDTHHFSIEGAALTIPQIESYLMQF